MIDFAEIRQRLAHRYPMLLVDRVTELVPQQQITAVKAVTCNEPWYRRLADGAAERAYAYPPMLLIESWCQTAGLLAEWGRHGSDPHSGQVALFGGLADVSFHGEVWPGDVIEHRVRLARAFSDTWIFDGESIVGGRAVLRVGRVLAALRPAEALQPARPELEGDRLAEAMR